MKAYFDTSVMVTLTTKEPRWDELSRWIVTNLPRPYFSDFGWGEYVSALGLKVRRGELTERQGADAIAEIADYLKSWTRLRISRQDLLDAASMVEAFELALRFPDAIHIATARRARCVLITADDRQFSAATRFGVEAINPYASVEKNPAA